MVSVHKEGFPFNKAPDQFRDRGLCGEDGSDRDGGGGGGAVSRTGFENVNSIGIKTERLTEGC